jgi:Galactose oxidase, central domain
MNDLRTEIRAAFEREQSAFPPPAALRAQVDAAINAHARAAAPTRQRAHHNLEWLMVAAAVLLTIAIVVGLMAARLMNLHPIPVKPGPVLPLAAWKATGNMVSPRSGHTATLLKDGKVLVAGGIFGNRVLASAELYDPSTGTWTGTGNMVTSRAFHTATLLPDGKVLVAGGYDSTLPNAGGPHIVASAELWNPSTGKWTATRGMVTPHYGQTATLLIDGTVLVAGGILRNFVMASAELYDPNTGAWIATGKIITPRAFHTATLLRDGRVFVAGGADYTNDVANGGLPEILATAELYNPVTRSWTATTSMAVPFAGDTATLLPDGRVLVAGSVTSVTVGSAEVYDPSTATWAATGSVYWPVAFHTATLLPDGTVLVLGDGGVAGAVNGALYYPGIRLWTATASTVVGSDATATLMRDGTVLVAGGSVRAVGGPATLASAQLYHPSALPVLPAAGVVAPGPISCLIRMLSEIPF